MALCALARRFYEFGVRLIQFCARPRALHQQGAYDQGECNQDGDEDGSE